tara:strand:- start:532 stop:672 length:141 start_codon:yes stop_codon:yes gene_type:complete
MGLKFIFFWCECWYSFAPFLPSLTRAQTPEGHIGCQLGVEAPYRGF